MTNHKEGDMRIELEASEASLLFRVARNRLIEMKQEIRHSTDSESKEYLRHKKRILNRILDKFQGVDERAHMKGYFEPVMEQ